MEEGFDSISDIDMDNYEKDHEKDNEEDNDNNEKNTDEEDDEKDEIDEKSSSTKRSWVWDHFTFNITSKKSRCNYCKALICTNKGSTSGMSNHVKSKHKITKNGNEMLQQKQLILQESLQNSAETVSLIFN
jgi:hypothetical protein